MGQGSRQGPGRPAKRTSEKDEDVIRIFVRADALRPFLDKMDAKPVTIPWLDHRRLRISVAEHAMETVENVPRLKQLISANPKPINASQGN